VEPVIETFLTISDEINWVAIDGGSPESKFTVPGGTPQLLITSTSSITVPGVITSGLQITEHPAASAAEIFLAAKIKGINIIKKHEKTTKEKKGGIISKENFIDISNLKNLELDKKVEQKGKK